MELETRSLDEWASSSGIPSVDFAKINVDGRELDILDGGGEVFRGIGAALIEVAFQETFQGRPLFSQVNDKMSAMGFSFFDFRGICQAGRAASPIAMLSNGQAFEGLALYVRDFPGRHQNTECFDVDRILKLSSICEVNGQVEFAFELLAWLEETLDAAEGSAEKVRVRKVFDEAKAAYLAAGALAQTVGVCA